MTLLKKLQLSAISISLIVSLLTCCFCVSVFAERDLSAAETKAAELKQLGLFKGVTDTDFDLGRAPTRAEAIVMLIRMLGKEQEAISGTGKHPFTDVEEWADKYIGYAYETGLTKGVSATQFGEGNANANMYLTFVLRALGYSDVSGDFSWDNPAGLALSVGILTSDINVADFLRADVALISYAALSANIKDSSRTMAQKLIEDGVFTQEKYDEVTDASKDDSNTVEVSNEKELIAALADDAVKKVSVVSAFEVKTDLVNDKIIEINAEAAMLECKITNNGTLNVKSNFHFGGCLEIENNGSIIVGENAVLGIYMSPFKNKGKLIVNVEGRVDVDRGGNLENFNMITNNGKIEITGNGGGLKNNEGATIENNGTVTINGYYNKGGKITGTGVFNTENALNQ